MSDRIHLSDCWIDEQAGIYHIARKVASGKKVMEECLTYSMKGEEELTAEVMPFPKEKLKVTLQGKSMKDFSEARILLAEIKQRDIYFLDIEKGENDREFTVDLEPVKKSLEYGRNKSAAILLECIEEGEYHRYTLWNTKAAKADKELQKEKRKWTKTGICTQPVYLTRETEDDEEENEIVPYILVSYVDKMGGWFLAFTSEVHLSNRTRICHLKYLTMKNQKVTLFLEIQEEGCVADGVFLRFRSKLKEEREEYFFTITQRKVKNGMTHIKAVLDIEDIPLKSLYWDARVRLKKENGDFWDAQISMTRNYRLFTALVYNGKYQDGNGFFFYPYNTGGKSLAFQFREEGEYDTARFRMKEILAFVLYRLLKPYWDRKHIRLVYEKFCLMAQDNGYYFFKYCMENKEEQRQGAHIYYVIDKNAPDRKKLEEYGDHLVDFMSFRHMIYVQAADLLISTDTRNHLYALRHRGSVLKRFLRKKEIVFLQHGVTALKKVDFFYGKGRSGSCNLFVVTSDFEKKIVEDYFGYSQDEIVNSGFARWDVLEDKSEGLREILIMPTWRTWLENASLEEFKESDYFRNYMMLLNSRRFQQILEENDLQANFYLHSKFREFLEDFSVDNERIRLIAFGEEPANELMMRCKMLVTDYSSVCWDVFYLDKPVVFFQFDREKYEEAHGSYLDMSKELFGDCADNVEGLLDELANCIRQDFKVQPKYEAMRQGFYKYVDDQNSRRICDAIVKRWPAKERKE